MFDYLRNNNAIDALNIDTNIIDSAEQVFSEIKPKFEGIDEISSNNQLKVITAMQKLGLSEHHITGSTGYGYGDIGREFSDELMAMLMGTEDAMVRHHWVSGTHTIYNCLQSLLRKGDMLLSITGKPYDTLCKVIGIQNYQTESDNNNFEVDNSNSHDDENTLVNNGIQYREVSMDENGRVNYDEVQKKLVEYKPEVVLIQKSRGYSSRKTLTKSELFSLVSIIRKKSPETIIFLDNCYGEYVEDVEPGDLGVDLLAGSLIKNPGGGLAPRGGYVAGKRNLVERVGEALTAPGLGRDMGATPSEFTRVFIQGSYFAPTTVAAAVKGAMFSAGLFKQLGFSVSPGVDELRGDIIQEISLTNKQQLIQFVKGIQRAGIVDSQVEPFPDDMPGYDCPVIMAAGTFIQGASLELSADAPLRPPYRVYQQGGLTLPHAVLGSIIAADSVLK